MNDIRLVKDVFSKYQLMDINRIINDSLKLIPLDANADEEKIYGSGINHSLGRFQIGNIGNKLPKQLIKHINQIANNDLSNGLVLHHALYTEYSSNFGQPRLPPHYDHDVCDLIINYQLSSNTQWDIGLNKTVYSLEDNSALVFNGNQYPHWRPHKEFKDGEYIKMLFFRFYNESNPSDYSSLNYSSENSMWSEIANFRDKISKRDSEE